MTVQDGWWRNLRWLHAFDRKHENKVQRLEAVMGVLSSGPSPNPNPSTGTAECERDLDLQPSVYFGLSRTHEEFGPFILSLKMDAFSGNATPFDSGSVVKKLKPVRGWEREQRLEFFNAYNFSTENDLGLALDRYPSRDLGCIKRYLHGEWPVQRGPHECWENKPQAEIWADQEPEIDSRACLWEGRCHQQVQTSHGSMESWSTDQDLYQQLEDYAGKITDPVELDKVLGLLDKCARTPVSHYIRDIVKIQEKEICG